MTENLKQQITATFQYLAAQIDKEAIITDQLFTNKDNYNHPVKLN